MSLTDRSATVTPAALAGWVLLSSGRFKILTQTGSYINEKFGPRPEFGDAALIMDMMRGKIKEEVAA